MINGVTDGQKERRPCPTDTLRHLERALKQEKSRIKSNLIPVRFITQSDFMCLLLLKLYIARTSLKRSLLEKLVVERAVSKHINKKVEWKEKVLQKNEHKQQEKPQRIQEV